MVCESYVRKSPVFQALRIYYMYSVPWLLSVLLFLVCDRGKG